MASAIPQVDNKSAAIQYHQEVAELPHQEVATAKCPVDNKSVAIQSRPVPPAQSDAQDAAAVHLPISPMAVPVLHNPDPQEVSATQSDVQGVAAPACHPIPRIYHHRPNARNSNLLTNPTAVRYRPYYRDRLRHLTLHYVSRACLLLAMS